MPRRAGYLHKPPTTPQHGQSRSLTVLTLHPQVDISHVHSLPGPLRMLLQHRAPNPCTQTQTRTRVDVDTVRATAQPAQLSFHLTPTSSLKASPGGSPYPLEPHAHPTARAWWSRSLCLAGLTQIPLARAGSRQLPCAAELQRGHTWLQWSLGVSAVPGSRCSPTLGGDGEEGSSQEGSLEPGGPAPHADGSALYGISWRDGWG